MEILAGMSCGFVMGVVFLGLGAMMLSTLAASRRPESKPGRPFSPATSMALLSLLLLLFWGAIGAATGFLYRLVAQAIPTAGLGSPNLAFTLSVALFSTALAVTVLLRRKAFWESVAMILAFAAIFGWLLPWLAS